MKVTVTFKNLEEPIVENWNCWNFPEVGSSDYIAVLFAKYWVSQNRTYKSNGRVTLDTLSIHSDGDLIGLRFYFKYPKAHNPRKALSADFSLPVSELSAQIETDAIEDICGKLAEEAVEKITYQLNL